MQKYPSRNRLVICRYVVLISLTGVGLGCLAMSQADSLIGVVVVYGIIISFAAAGVSPYASGTIVSRWFHRRRGTAISVLSAGASFGGLLMIPFLTYLRIATDWQTAWLVTGLIILKRHLAFTQKIGETGRQLLGSVAPDEFPEA